MTFTDNNKLNDNVLLEMHLESLYQVSQILSCTLNFRETQNAVLKTLSDIAHIHHGMISLLDERSGDLLVSALHKNPDPDNSIRYRQGEGVVGAILSAGKSLVIPCPGDDKRFLDRLRVYDQQLPFIGVPITIGKEVVGVLAAQPAEKIEDLSIHQRLLEMVANLIGQRVRLAKKIEDEQVALKTERDSLRRKVRNEHGFENIVGHAQSIRFVFEQLRQVAKWNTTVLIRGESGTGKELIANAIHYNSPRVNGPFIKLNCAALPDTLLESELFGHEKGAFTGAVTQRKGRFELANGGTIFLDEIGEITPAFQAKLLRVLQEGEFERVGGVKTLQVDVRVVAATNKHLEQQVQDGNFREDLYYRLNVMPIHVPALRERTEDIPDLCHFLVTKIGKSQKRTLTVDASAMSLLMCYDWPGNVRELENCLERAAVMCSDGQIDANAINLTGMKKSNSLPVRSFQETTQSAMTDYDAPQLDERERVIAALEQAGWVQAKAARLLSMTPRQIAYRIQTLNIQIKQM